jgi:short-subunit dehydrogenase
VLAARRTERLQALAAELGGDTLVVTTDMRDPAQIHALIEATLAHHGRVDVLVNNAGQGLHLPLEQIALDDFAAITELNVYAPLVAMQAVIAPMRAQGAGAIVNVSSGTSRMTLPGVGAYAATKSALNMLSDVARAELADDGIVVSNVLPFVTTTEFHDTLRAGAMPAGRKLPFEPDPPEKVAEVILGLIESGEREVSMFPG